MKGFTANPRQWYKRERAQLLNDRSLQNGGRRYTNIAPASGLNATRPPRTYNQALKNSSIKKSRLKLWLTVEAPAGPIRVKPSRKDNNYSSVRDFCPPPDILPKAIQDQAEGLWRWPCRSSPSRIRKALAANLHLDCATYLTSKRRIFVSRLGAWNLEKSFEKHRFSTGL